MQTVRLSLIATMAALAGWMSSAVAQSVQGLPGNAVVNTAPGALTTQEPTQFLIEPEVQIKGDNIKQRTYRSQAVGQNKNWDLDIGRFQPPINDDPNQLASDLDHENYSGFRLRLPFRGGMEQ